MDTGEEEGRREERGEDRGRGRREEEESFTITKNSDL